MSETILGRFPPDVWPVGPPHHPSGEPSSCAACGAAHDRAIHSAPFWAKQGVTVVTAAEYVEWRATAGTATGGVVKRENALTVGEYGFSRTENP